MGAPGRLRAWSLGFPANRGKKARFGPFPRRRRYFTRFDSYHLGQLPATSKCRTRNPRAQSRPGEPHIARGHLEAAVTEAYQPNRGRKGSKDTIEQRQEHYWPSLRAHRQADCAMNPIQHKYTTPVQRVAITPKTLSSRLSDSVTITTPPATMAAPKTVSNKTPTRIQFSAGSSF